MDKRELCLKLVQATEKYECGYQYNLSDYSKRPSQKTWAEMAREAGEGDKLWY